MLAPTGVIFSLAGHAFLVSGCACVQPVLSCAVATCVVVFNAFFSYVVPTLALQASDWFFSSFFDHTFLLHIVSPLVMALLAVSALVNVRHRWAVH